MALKSDQVLPLEFVTKTAEYARSSYQLTIPAKWKYEDLLLPEVWKNQGERLHPGDFVTCLAEDGSYDVDFRVIASDRGGYVLLRPLRTWIAPQAEIAAAGEPRVGFAPGVGFVVYDQKGEALSKHPGHDAADAALKAYLETREAAHDAA